MTTKKPYKRRLRNFLIYPRFQLGLMAAQAAVIATIFAAVQLENHAAFARMAKMGSDAGIPKTSAYFLFVTDQAHEFLVHTSLVLALALAVSSCITLYLSFRLAGPIYRLRKHMGQIAEQGAQGIAPLRFRNGDFYSDLPEVVNRAVTKLQEERSPDTHEQAQAS